MSWEGARTCSTNDHSAANITRARRDQTPVRERAANPVTAAVSCVRILQTQRRYSIRYRRAGIATHPSPWYHWRTIGHDGTCVHTRLQELGLRTNTGQWSQNNNQRRMEAILAYRGFGKILPNRCDALRVETWNYEIENAEVKNRRQQISIPFQHICTLEFDACLQISKLYMLHVPGGYL